MSDRIYVLCISRFDDSQLARLRAVSPKLKVVQIPTSDLEGIGEPLEQAEVMYTYALPASLTQMPHLRWVQLSSAGVEHLENHPIMRAPHIHLTTVSGIHAGPMAEYVLAMMLALARHLPKTMDFQRRAEWPANRWHILRSTELRGATVGIIGYGSIGREIARLATCFGMPVLALKRNPHVREDRGYIEEGLGDPDGHLPGRIFGPADLQELLGESDFVAMTIPSTPTTRGMMDAAAFRAMKRSAFFINVGRGDVVVEDDLVRALKEGWIAGAALDVFAQEPLPADSELWKLPNVILTPHISALTPMYEERASILFSENLRRYLAGEPLLNEVNREEGY